MMRCLFGFHRTAIVEGETIGLIGCRHCGHVAEVWTLLRPEQDGHAAFWARNDPPTNRDRRPARVLVQWRRNG